MSAQEEGQVLARHPLFVERQDVGAALGLEQVVGILHPLGDALAGDNGTKVVLGEKGREVLVGNFGVDRHGLLI